MNRSTAVSLALLFPALCLSVQALAGPNAGGILAVHDANVAYTVDTGSYCDLGSTPAACDSIDTNVEASDPANQRVWKVYAAFPDTASPRLKALSFGVHYPADSLIVTAHGACIGDLNNGAAELPGPGWPGSDTGTAVVFQDTQTTHLVECYWLAGYAYYGTTRFDLTANPDSALGGTFVDDSVPGIQDSIADYGRLGFGSPGYVPCPATVEDQPLPGAGSRGVIKLVHR